MKLLALLKSPSARELAREDLETAERNLLREYERAAYHKHMVAFWEETVRRLQATSGEKS
jgi:hypothetical protein